MKLAITYETSHGLMNYCLINEDKKEILFDTDRPATRGGRCPQYAAEFGKLCKRQDLVSEREIIENLPQKLIDGHHIFFPIHEDELRLFNQEFLKH